MYDSDSDAGAVVALVAFVFWLVIMVPVVWAHVKIIKKAGYSGWNVLWTLVPVANIVMFFVFAFSTWPIERRMTELEQTRRF